MKISVTYIISSFMRCGPINMLYSLISSLDRDQFEISIITLKPEPDNTRIKDFEDLGVKVKRAGDRDIHFLFGLKASISNKIAELNPDIIHSHGPWADYYAGAIKEIPTVVNIHNKLSEDYIPLYGSLIGTLTTLMDARAMRHCTKAIAVSDSVASIAKNKYGIDSQVIVNGVNTDKFKISNTDEVIRLRNRLGINKDAYVFLHIGNMIDRKNPKLILASYKRIANKMPNSELIFLGDGPLLEDCKKEFGDYASISFCGNVSNVDEFLAASDCMISATSSDGMSMATLEALACGLRALVSNIDVHREILERFITDPNEFIIREIKSQDFSEGMFFMYKQGRKNNSVNKELLSSKMMASSYEKLYRSLIS